ncbi:hypothetical protein, partial [Planktothrix agardhii]|uniref:hypothetical protein n=1 Tax=Planktothrix agardhii TaxID=1160 RepID=UPI001F1686D6
FVSASLFLRLDSAGLLPGNKLDCNPRYTMVWWFILHSFKPILAQCLLDNVVIYSSLVFA